jgi:hypothetical protein
VTSSTGFCPEHEAIVDVGSRLATSGTHRLAVCALLFAPVLAVADDLKLAAASLEAQASRQQASSAEAGRLPFEARLARAALQVATGALLEGVKP